MSSLLPPSAYYDRRWWEVEKRRVFGQTYNLVAYESDLPRPGDCVVADVGAGQVALVRQADGAIGAGPDARTAAMSGGTAGIPRSDAAAPGGFAVGRWAGMVFVHPGEAPVPFEEWLGAYADMDRAGPYAWDDLVEVDRIDVPLRCNWKLYVENHVDVYHLWYLHAGSLGMYDHAGLTWWQAGPHWGCVEAVRPGEARARPGMLAIVPLPDAERPLLRANLIFPNVPMTTMETSVATFQVVPTGPETCRLDLRVRGQRGSALTDRSAFLRVQRDEDGTACEEVQRAVRSRAFAVGPTATAHELPVRRFHEHLLALMGR